jgi:Peptidase family M48
MVTPNQTPNEDRRLMLKALGATALGAVVPDVQAQEGFNMGAYAGAIAAKIQSGDYVELSPAHVNNYSTLLQEARQHGHASGPVKVLLVKKEFGKIENDPKPLVNVIKEADDTTYVKINGAAHQWTAAYVQEILNPTNDAIQAARDKEVLIEGLQAGLSPAVLAAHETHAQKLQLKTVPKLYINKTNKNHLPEAHCQQTREGEAMILVNRFFVSQLDEREQKAVLAHELAHIANGDLRPERVAQLHNDRTGALHRQAEGRADLTSLRATCDPDGLHSALERESGRNTPESTHPSFADRIKALADPKHLPAGCKKSR